MIFIGLGSNLGERQNNLTKGLALLMESGVDIVAISSIYESQPWGNTRQGAFINAVIQVNYAGTPEQLMLLLMQTELSLGRVRTEKWGPRTLDLDLLSFHEERISIPELTVPHPGISARAFVLIPWNEIAPQLVIPGQNRDISSLCSALDTSEIDSVKYYSPFILPG